MKKIIKINIKKNKINKIIEKYHFKIKDHELIEDILEEIKKKTDVIFYFEIENEVIYAIYTLGEEFDELLNKYHAEEDLLREYAAECLAQELLRDGYESGEKIIYEVSGKYPGEYNFVGENQEGEKYKERETKDHSYNKKITEIFEMIKPDEVRLNASGVMIPSKSVAFFAKLDNQDMKSCKNICRNCKNTCSYRNERKKERE